MCRLNPFDMTPVQYRTCDATDCSGCQLFCNGHGSWCNSRSRHRCESTRSSADGVGSAQKSSTCITFHILETSRLDPGAVLHLLSACQGVQTIRILLNLWSKITQVWKRISMSWLRDCDQPLILLVALGSALLSLDQCVTRHFSRLSWLQPPAST